MTSSPFSRETENRHGFKVPFPANGSELHPVWRDDLAALGPWHGIDLEKKSTGQCGALWFSPTFSETPVIWVCETCRTTMEMAFHLIQQNRLAPWDSLITISQNAGKGQMGREWISPAGNLYASWIWPDLTDKTEKGGVPAGMIPLVVGYVVADVLQILGIRLAIKWPNDLLVRDRKGQYMKVGGILVERKNRDIVVGIGINLVSAPDEQYLRAKAAFPASVLTHPNQQLTPLTLWKLISTAGKKSANSILTRMPAETFIRCLTPKMVGMGKPVRIRRNATSFTATMIGLAEDGSLCLKRQGKIEKLYTGSVYPI